MHARACIATREAARCGRALHARGLAGAAPRPLEAVPFDTQAFVEAVTGAGVAVGTAVPLYRLTGEAVGAAIAALAASSVTRADFERVRRRRWRRTCTHPPGRP